MPKTTPKICGIPASQNKQNRKLTPETLNTDVQCLHIECLFTHTKIVTQYLASSVSNVSTKGIQLAKSYSIINT